MLAKKKRQTKKFYSSHDYCQCWEGKFDILTPRGSFAPAELTGSGSGRVGGMSIKLAQPNGHVVGGLLAGLLIVASHVQVVVASFLPSGSLEKPKKHKSEEKPARAAKLSLHTQASNPGQNNINHGVPNYKPDSELASCNNDTRFKKCNRYQHISGGRVTPMV